MAKLAIIMRGLPGSGKSTLAKSLAGEEGIIHSTDAYFYVNGTYKFEKKYLPYFHNKNFTAFCESLKQGVPVVVCDNCNARHRDYERYVIAAKRAGYTISIVKLHHLDPAVAASRTTHNVPAGAIRRMRQKWEE